MQFRPLQAPLKKEEFISEDGYFWTIRDYSTVRNCRYTVSPLYGVDATGIGRGETLAGALKNSRKNLEQLLDHVQKRLTMIDDAIAAENAKMNTDEDQLQ